MDCCMVFADANVYELIDASFHLPASDSETYEAHIDLQNVLEYNESVVAIVLEGELTLEEKREPSSQPAGKSCAGSTLISLESCGS